MLEIDHDNPVVCHDDQINLTLVSGLLRVPDNDIGEAEPVVRQSALDFLNSWDLSGHRPIDSERFNLQGKSTRQEASAPRDRRRAREEGD
jgi:hypothetical protein